MSEAPAEEILVVEDEGGLAEAIADNLELEGYLVEVVGDGAEALERIRAAPPALVVLDVMLPSLDGFAVCERLRREGNGVPILFLTAKGDSADRVRGLEVGGDDFLAKPFDLRELILRVRAILRRARTAVPAETADRLVLGDAEVDFEGLLARVGDRVLQLSAKEAMILRFLTDKADEVVPRAEIVDRVWGRDAFSTSRTIDNFIVRLRRVLEPDPRNPRYIHTIRGLGYRLTP